MSNVLLAPTYTLIFTPSLHHSVFLLYVILELQARIPTLTYLTLYIDPVDINALATISVPNNAPTVCFLDPYYIVSLPLHPLSLDLSRTFAFYPSI